ncbi:hypothetical protein FACS189434_03010 [Bacteroidia bacterium]|nr:hypothetical protein FACS189434_03010 [Bacteroidia bacterium]
METRKIHIGQFVKDAVNNSEYTFAEVARRIGISRQQLNGWFQKDDLYVKDLYTVAEVINKDLLKPFCLPNKEEDNPTKILLQIEVGKDKINDVLNFIDDRNLYRILKQ